MLCTRSVRPSQIGPRAFEIFAERAVVDQGVADRGHAAGRAQRVAAHQHAAAGRGRGGAARIVGPGERVEHLEEEDEGRDEQPLGKAFAAQLHHQRGENETARLRPGDQARQHIRRIDDVGIGEQQVVRRQRRGLGKLDALLLRPQLAGPAGRQRAPRHDGQALGGAERGRGVARDKRRAVAALVVDQDHMERARIILPQQRGDGLADACGLVARRNDGGDRRPRPSAAPLHAGRRHRARPPARIRRAPRGDRARSQAPLTL